MWIIDVLQNQKSTQAALSKKHGIALSSIGYFVDRSVKGKMLHKRGGRPPALDENAQNAFATFCRLNPAASWKILRGQLKDFQRETIQRRLPHGIIPNPVKYMTKRSVLTYINRFARVNCDIMDEEML